LTPLPRPELTPGASFIATSLEIAPGAKLGAFLFRILFDVRFDQLDQDLITGLSRLNTEDAELAPYVVRDVADLGVHSDSPFTHASTWIANSRISSSIRADRCGCDSFRSIATFVPCMARISCGRFAHRRL
jgi:hypothetical protein